MHETTFKHIFKIGDLAYIKDKYTRNIFDCNKPIETCFKEIKITKIEFSSEGIIYQSNCKNIDTDEYFKFKEKDLITKEEYKENINSFFENEIKEIKKRKHLFNKLT